MNRFLLDTSNRPLVKYCVLQFLDAFDLAKFGSVCKLLHRLTQLNLAWRTLLFNELSRFKISANSLIKNALAGSLRSAQNMRADLLKRLDDTGPAEETLNKEKELASHSQPNATVFYVCRWKKIYVTSHYFREYLANKLLPDRMLEFWKFLPHMCYLNKRFLVEPTTTKEKTKTCIALAGMCVLVSFAFRRVSVII